MSQYSSHMLQLLPVTPDWHAPGLYVVLDSNGRPIYGTLDETPYSARATLARDFNLRWSAAKSQGYTMARLLPVQTVVDASDDLKLEVILFPASSNVRGVANIGAQYRGKPITLAKATLMTDGPAEVSVKMPTRLTVEELRYLSSLLALFAERLTTL